MSFVVVCSSLLVARWLLSVVGCLRFDVWCVFVAGCWLLVGCCLLSVVCGLFVLFGVCDFIVVGMCCLACFACCLLFVDVLSCCLFVGVRVVVCSLWFVV